MRKTGSVSIGSQRLGRVEIAARDVDPPGDQLAKEAGTNAGRLEMALDGTVRRGAGAHVLVDLLHLDDVAFEAGDLGDARDLALAVGHALKLDDQADGGADLP